MDHKQKIFVGLEMDVPRIFRSSQVTHGMGIARITNIFAALASLDRRRGGVCFRGRDLVNTVGQENNACGTVGIGYGIKASRLADFFRIGRYIGE